MSAHPLTSLELRRAIRARFAWPGGYALFGVCSDGGVLCAPCMAAEYRQIAYARRHDLRDGWKVEAVDCTANCDEPPMCDHCGEGL